ncbi:MAG TPA: rhamnulokinase family protein [Actinocrinis sp.]|nr:rhamnulokinase family protein [Actinocrinis sp.]
MSQGTKSRENSGRAKAFAAVDLGASSGRVIRGVIGPDLLDVAEVHRFPNEPRVVRGALRWDIAALERGVREGLRRAGQVDGIGIDSWAVDYGLLDADGRLIDDPIHYRDRRTEGVPEQVFKHISAQRLYALTGIQNQPFNTIHQLYAARQSTDFKAASRILLIPDLLSWKLTGVAGTEVTNASTTGLFDTQARSWSGEIFDALGLDAALFAPLRDPGEPAGIAQDFSAPVFTAGSHDTASAVAAVPAAGEHFGYISSGTWSLVGVELRSPVRTEQSRAANFTNEIGVDGTVRFLRNVMGLWLLQECLREWGRESDLSALLGAAAQVAARRSVIDASDPVFLAPGGMPERIVAACQRSDQPIPRDHAEIVRCILDSLAEAYRRTLIEAAELSGKRIELVHIVGGGARNELLCQLTADAVGLPVLAGPVEAAAIGNLLVQARAAGPVGGDLADLRALVARTQPLRRFEPSCG